MSEAMPQTLTILGATGSIGTSTLDVVARHPECFRLFALSAQTQMETLFTLVCRFAPRFAVVATDEQARALQARLQAAGSRSQVLAGPKALCEVAAHSEVDTVMAAIVGAAGLAPTLAAARAGKRLLLANKEALVCAGALLMQTVRESGARLLPIDSEHNAIFQALPENYAGNAEVAGVRRILLTASGGPFRTFDLAQMAAVTAQQACAHPRWSMGRKISVDSATLMNKGLEVIEAHWLFSIACDQIDVVVHPESIVHSLVEYRDGSVIAQLGNPDMRTPIAHALAYPRRIESGVASLDLCALAQLNFEAPDLLRFPCLALAYEVLRGGGAAATVLNAANEEAVSAFLGARLGFGQIAEVIAAVLEQTQDQAVDSLEAVAYVDGKARELARRHILSRSKRV